VDLFFVLSGFLVSGLLFREYQRHGSVDVVRFLIRRGFKIYPGFWVLLAVTVAFRIGLGAPVPGRQLMGEGLFVQNYVGGLWNHTWSLAVEEHFYLLLALMTAWLVRPRRRRRTHPLACLPAIFAVVAIISVVLRVRTSVRPFSLPTHIFATHIRMDSLFFGVLLSYCWHFKGLATHTWLARRSTWLFGIGVSLLLPAFLFPQRTTWIPVAGLTLFYLGSGALLLAMLYSRIPDTRAVRGLASIGAFSYSIYLWHMPVQQWVIPVIEGVIDMPMGWYAYAAVYLVGSVVVGIQACRVIEYPMLRLRDRLYPADQRHGSVTSSNSPMPLSSVVVYVGD